jgi:hypothetical protein
VENNSSIFSLFLKIQVIFIAKVYCLYTTGWTWLLFMDI